MITREQLKIVDGIRSEIEGLEAMLSGFGSPYVTTMIGLVDVNRADSHNPSKSKHSGFFHNKYPEFRNEMTAKAEEFLRHRIKELELEMSKYIG